MLYSIFLKKLPNHCKKKSMLTFNMCKSTEGSTRTRPCLHHVIALRRLVDLQIVNKTWSFIFCTKIIITNRKSFSFQYNTISKTPISHQSVDFQPPILHILWSVRLMSEANPSPSACRKISTQDRKDLCTSECSPYITTS
jgi:hypothetical protein